MIDRLPQALREPARSVARRLESGRWDVPLLVLAGALVFLPGLGAHDLWNPDEPRYAEVAREMLLDGQYLVPHLNGEVYTQKPPLFFWAICLASGLTGGLDETAARLPSAVAAIGAIALTFLLARLFFGRRAAWLAAVVYATCAKVLWQGHVGQIDMLLGFWVLLAVYLWALGWVRERPGLYPWFFVVTGVATVTKGPAGFLPPLLSIVAFLAVHRDWRPLRELRVGRGFLIWAAVVLAWLVPAVLAAGEDYFRDIVFGQNLTRYVNPWGHYRPWYYFLKVLPQDFFPWIYFLPAAVWAGWRGLEGERRRRFLFALAWVVVTVVFFSVSPGKRTVYILSMYPGLALAVAAGLDSLSPAAHRLPRLGPQGIHRRWLVWPAGFLTLLLLAAAALLPRLAAGKPEAEPLGADLPPKVAAVVGFVGLMAAVAAWEALRGRIPGLVASLAVGMGLAAPVMFAALLPRADAVKSARPLSELLVVLAAPEEPYGIYPELDPPFLFYTRRFAVELTSEEELHAFAARPGPVWLLAERDDLAELAEPLPLVEVARDRDLVDGYVLLTRPETAAERSGGP